MKFFFLFLLIVCNCKKNVVFYGASVTHQNGGYVTEIARKMPEWNVLKYGYPGMGLNICDLDLILKDNPTYVFLDWSLNDYNGDKKVLKTVVWKILNSSAVPIFIHFPRLNQCFRKIIVDIDELSEAYNIDVIDLRKAISIKDLSNGLLRDVCHTLPLGAKRYADEILKKFYEKSVYEVVSFPCPDNAMVQVKTVNTQITTFNSLTFFLYGEIIRMKINVGPSSNFIDIYGDGNFIRRNLLWDCHCHYNRSKYGLPLQSQKNKEFKFLVRNLNFSRAACRRNFTWNIETLKPSLEILEICYYGNLTNIVVDGVPYAKTSRL